MADLYDTHEQGERVKAGYGKMAAPSSWAWYLPSA